MLGVTQARKGAPVAALCAVSEQFWALKYRLADAAGAPVEQSIEDTWDRIATALLAELGEFEP